ncbi:MAG: alpha/beta hydrolase [Anaerolineae bacterium]
MTDAATGSERRRRPHTIRGGRVLRLTVFTLAAMAAAGVILTAVMAWEYARAVLNPGCQGPRESLATLGYPAEPVTFTSRQGYMLRGWYSPGSAHPEIAIVVLPGHAGNTFFALDNAAILAEAGFSTLVYEHRSCADPSLTASTGYYEADDLLGAVDYLQTRPDVGRIGVLGLSEGGTASLLAASREPALEVIVAQGGYADLRDDLLDPTLDLPPYDRFLRRLIVVAMSVQLGTPARNASPVAVIDQISPRPLLLVYGEYEARSGELLLAAAGENAELWIVPGAGHGAYQLAAPGEYERRMVEFFTRAFGLEDGGLPPAGGMG